jgi:hypothetical protein
MSDLLSFTENTAEGRFRLKAAAVFTQHDGVQIGPDGKVYPIKCSDYASVANVGSSVVAATTVIGAYSWPYGKSPIYRDPATGNLFCVSPDVTGASPGFGLRVSKYSPSGTLLGTLSISASGSEQTYAPKIRALSNGNLLVTWAPNSSADYRFAIFDLSLNIIKASTSIDTPLDHHSDVLALSAGGFMVSYRKAGGLQRIAVYDNAGNVVTASATVQAWTGAAGIVTSKLAQLSNGNVVLVCTSAYATTIGTYFGIFSVLGAAVLAMANVDATANGGTQPDVAVVNGTFSFAYANAANTVVLRVYNNAGALQGGAVSFTVPGASATTNQFKLLTNGTAFYLLTMHATSLWWNLTMMPVTGANNVTYTAGTFTAAGGSLVIDAAIEGDRLVALHSQSSAAPALGFFVMNLTTMAIETNTTNMGGSSAYPTIVLSEDFTFIVYCDTTTPGSVFRVMKWANTAIVGVAKAAAAVDALVDIYGGAGAYLSNAIKGTSSKQFDHSAANIYGNKGALMTNGTVLKGF